MEVTVCVCGALFSLFRMFLVFWNFKKNFFLQEITYQYFPFNPDQHYSYSTFFVQMVLTNKIDYFYSIKIQFFYGYCQSPNCFLWVVQKVVNVVIDYFITLVTLDFLVTRSRAQLSNVLKFNKASRNVQVCTKIHMMLKIRERHMETRR